MVLLASLLFTVVLTIQLEKHRFFQEVRGDDFRWIQTQLYNTISKKEKGSIREIGLRTDTVMEHLNEDSTVSPNCLTGVSAFQAFRGSMCITMAFIFVLLLHDLMRFIMITRWEWIVTKWEGVLLVVIFLIVGTVVITKEKRARSFS